jgi:hypothetical protein
MRTRLHALVATFFALALALAPAAALAAKGPYVPRKPEPRTQVQKTADERGGVHPCATHDPGFGIYERWNRGPSLGQMLVPARGGVTKDGRFDVLVHFHGHDPVRKEWVPLGQGTILVGITLGIGSGVYEQTMGGPRAFEELIASVEREVAKLRGLPKARARRIGLMAWSAGYGAVEHILRTDYGKRVVDTVVLLDGLHTGYEPDGSLEESGLTPFVEFAKLAKAGKRLMYVSHSSIVPPDYASTTETVDYLVHALGGRMRAAKPRRGDPLGLDLNAKFDAGNFHARGFDGNDKPDHCAHLGLVREVVKSYVRKRWNSPKAYGPKSQAAVAEKPRTRRREAP